MPPSSQKDPARCHTGRGTPPRVRGSPRTRYLLLNTGKLNKSRGRNRCPDPRKRTGGDEKRTGNQTHTTGTVSVNPCRGGHAPLGRKSAIVGTSPMRRQDADAEDFFQIASQETYYPLKWFLTRASSPRLNNVMQVRPIVLCLLFG